MKHRVITIITALFCFTLAYAGSLSVESISLKPGETKELKFSLSPYAVNMSGVQFDMTLPEGFVLKPYNDDKVYLLSSNQADDLTCTVSDLEGNTYRFMLYSNTLQNLKEGELMRLNLQVSSTKALDSYEISINNVRFSDKDGNVTKENGVNANVKVTDFFTLIYKVNDVEYKSYVVEYGATITAESAPTKEGYTFSGWSEIPATMPAHDVVVTGSYTVNSYTLTYMVDGQEYKTYTIPYGTTLTPETEPVKEGYTFSGWSAIPETMPAYDVTVTGTFNINKYKLTYIIDDVEYKTIEVEYGAVVPSESEPTKEGYTFSGWSEIPETMPAKDVVVTGSFTVNSYTLTYILDGKEYKSSTIPYGTAIIPEDEPEREGYTFSGWFDIPAYMPSHDVKVTGTFTVNKYLVTYMYFDQVLETDSVAYGSPITLPELMEPGTTIKIIWMDVPKTMPAHDIIIQADQTDAISDITNEKQIKAYYLPNGQPIAKPQRGINIIRMNDGTVKKIMIK